MGKFWIDEVMELMEVLPFEVMISKRREMLNWVGTGRESAACSQKQQLKRGH